MYIHATTPPPLNPKVYATCPPKYKRTRRPSTNPVKVALLESYCSVQADLINTLGGVDICPLLSKETRQKIFVLLAPL